MHYIPLFEALLMGEILLIEKLLSWLGFKMVILLMQCVLLSLIKV